MALTIPANCNDSISLEEFIADINAILDRDDESTLIALAPRLRQLANNRRFLADLISEELGAWDNFQSGSAYTSQVFQLAVGRGFMVRANIWEPPRPREANPRQRDNLFMYLQPHDHNFSFLTVGYLGAGYQTAIYECDPQSVTGTPGDRVEMTFSETTTLPEGKVMLYRAGRDIHRQEHPTEYSISLNLLVSDSKQTLREQHYFDLERKTIAACMNASPGHRRLICYLARFVANESTKGKLDTIRIHNPIPRVRLTATESLVALAPNDAVLLWTSAIADRHPFVRGAAKQALARLEEGDAIDRDQRMTPSRRAPFSTHGTEPALDRQR